MLARSFMSHTDLDITEEEHSALVKVLGMLERGELVHVPYENPSVPNGFNLGTFKNVSKCGTVGCIAGWCDMLYGTRFQAKHMGRKSGDPLLQLFTPVRQTEVTTEQAARALSNYLTTGEPDWKSVLENSHD